MSTADCPEDRSCTSIKWEVCELAILEVDNAKMPERIGQARHAIHDRAEEILTDSSINENERRAPIMHSGL